MIRIIFYRYRIFKCHLFHLSQILVRPLFLYGFGLFTKTCLRWLLEVRAVSGTCNFKRGSCTSLDIPLVCVGYFGVISRKFDFSRWWVRPEQRLFFAFSCRILVLPSRFGLIRGTLEKLPAWSDLMRLKVFYWLLGRRADILSDQLVQRLALVTHWVAQVLSLLIFKFCSCMFDKLYRLWYSKRLPCPITCLTGFSFLQLCKPGGWGKTRASVPTLLK